MDESSASGGGRERNKRFWTAEEDRVLVSALSDLAVDPHWRCDNGFRSGYMVRLEEVISHALIGCGLKASPHIDSPLKTLVAKFRAISQMLNTSGFVWDDERKLVSIKRVVYDEVIQVAKIYMEFPFRTFKNSRIYMAKTMLLVSHLKVMLKQLTIWKKLPLRRFYLIHDDEGVAGSGTVNSPPSKKIKTEKTAKRRRKSDGARSSNELASLQTFMKDMNVHLSTMANVMASTNEREKDTHEIEKKLVQQSEQVLEELLSLNLQDVTPKQVFEVAEDLASKPHKLIIFSKCPDALKSSYVKSLIRENNDA
uniref:Myb/SANT-like domain-containing protein n=1 Tax=Chenopodium quinoa TaxID=63459 RepID=A0A803N4T5_CHEQI